MTAGYHIGKPLERAVFPLKNKRKKVKRAVKTLSCNRPLSKLWTTKNKEVFDMKTKIKTKTVTYNLIDEDNVPLDKNGHIAGLITELNALIVKSDPRWIRNRREKEVKGVEWAKDKIAYSTDNNLKSEIKYYAEWQKIYELGVELCDMATALMAAGV
jgi:hypothetical protein